MWKLSIIKSSSFQWSVALSFILQPPRSLSGSLANAWSWRLQGIWTRHWDCSPGDGWKGLALFEDVEIDHDESCIRLGQKWKVGLLVEFFGQCCQHLYIQCCSVFLARKGQLGILWCFDYAVIGSKFDIHLRPSTDGISKKQATLSPRFRKFIQMPETNLFNLAIQRYQDISKIDGPLQTHSDFLGEKKLFRGRH